MARSDSTRDPAQEIADFFIARLEEGVKPWVRPWDSSGLADRPLRANGEGFRGINWFWLDLIRSAKGYSSPYWLTYKQATELGGQVRKGEKGETALFYRTGHTKGSAAGESDNLDDSTESSLGRFYRILKYYTVFSADQCDGLPGHFYERPEQRQIAPFEHQAKLDEFFGRIPAEIHYGGDKACYRPAIDDVLMPPVNAFRSMPDFASCLAHELVHWSGGASRLQRTFGKSFGDPKYQAEELVAAMAGSLVSRLLGLPEFVHDNEASYLASWVKGLQDNKGAILTAASKAYDAFEYLTSFQQPAMRAETLPIAA